MDELIVAKINEFRSDPTELIARLTEMKNHFQDLDFKDVNKVRF
jgi:hypothetical protein